MSFFGDLVNSIGGDKAPTPPRPNTKPPISYAIQSSTDLSRPISKLAIQTPANPVNGKKRKAEDDVPLSKDKFAKPSAPPNSSVSLVRRPTAPPLNAPKPASDKAATPTIETAPKVPKLQKPAVDKPVPLVVAATPQKAPARGSFADLMARAKQAQEQKAQTPVGLIKHQTVKKEKISKLAERKREEQQKGKADKGKLGTRNGDRNAKNNRRRSVSPVKRKDLDRELDRKTGRPSAPKPEYKGTMGTTSRRSEVVKAGRPAKKPKKYDDYLGTDEDEDSDLMDGYGEDEEDDYGSDASSDMEAGAFDIDEEEQEALRTAKKEDAKELALENKLKREKEERKRKLALLANKRR